MEIRVKDRIPAPKGTIGTRGKVLDLTMGEGGEHLLKNKLAQTNHVTNIFANEQQQ